MESGLEEKIKALSEKHPVPQEEKLERRMRRLERMHRFYEEKAPIAPEAQGVMFNGFVSALAYAETTIKMYRKLTKELADLAGDKNEINIAGNITIGNKQQAENLLRRLDEYGTKE